MEKKAALVGNPNCGKTTLFNLLTGQRQYVGNWAGVTVDKKEGRLSLGRLKVRLTDLPGIYSLSPYSLEEGVALGFLLDERPDVVINIVDAGNLERNLYLTVQLMELGLPMVVALNMVDEVESRDGRVDHALLQRRLGVPVLPISARRGEGVQELVELAGELCQRKVRLLPRVRYDRETAEALEEIAGLIARQVPEKRLCAFFAARLLEGDTQTAARLHLGDSLLAKAKAAAARYHPEPQQRQSRLADARWRLIRAGAAGVVRYPRREKGPGLTQRLDRILISRVWGLPLFLLIFFCIFSITFGPLGNTLKTLLEGLIGRLGGFFGGLLAQSGAPDWTYSLLLDAVIGGVGGVLAFLPQIMLLFFCLSILEDSGYMARAAFLMDRLLQGLGLTGKCFIPMLMGFGCTTPAVMAARGMGDERERRLTVLLIPFMSCSARLPIYALFAGVFFKGHENVAVLGMYLLGLAVAVLCGLLLRHTLFRGPGRPFVMELPPYRLPTLGGTLRHMWQKCVGFLTKAGTIIFSMNVVIWLLQSFTPSLQYTVQPEQSLFGALGRALAPLFAPLGFGEWQAAVALLSGLIAKESVVATFGVLFGGQGGLTAAISAHFTPQSGLAFMVFSLLYMPCISAFVAISRELGSLRAALSAALLQCSVAYLVSFAAYRVGGMFLGGAVC
ncbi:ferrous iron transport protein B [Harryflintia acetispora]|uniref:ferrous iron transport protein B n=1 Tax=Harryflintia acetispora TaxID=1849041 RepID=UPI00189BF7E7|nr:ferrous iron transport protein B [Harryflintia acetispora]